MNTTADRCIAPTPFACNDALTLGVPRAVAALVEHAAACRAVGEDPIMPFADDCAGLCYAAADRRLVRALTDIGLGVSTLEHAIAHATNHRTVYNLTHLLFPLTDALADAAAVPARIACSHRRPGMDEGLNPSWWCIA